MMSIKSIFSELLTIQKAAKQLLFTFVKNFKNEIQYKKRYMVGNIMKK